MDPILSSTLLLTVLMGIGLVFFLRAASKDRTTVVEVNSSRPPLEVLEGLDQWLQQRGWQTIASDPTQQVLRFEGQVDASVPMAVLLSLLGATGATALGLVLRQLLPTLSYWPLLLALMGPLAGFIYLKKARRQETLELKLLPPQGFTPTTLRLRAHRDELIALERSLGRSLNLHSDGRLLSSPI
jgi:hypothetical protein